MGHDRIFRRGDQLIVCSESDMDDWQVQHTRRTAIYLDGAIWCLVGKQSTDTKELLYFLDPWPDHGREIPGRRICYDEAYVQARDAAAKRRRIEEGLGPLLYHSRALIGFLPSQTKSRIEAGFGVPARNATFLSLIIEVMLFFVLGAYLQIFVYGSMRDPALVVYIPSLILAVPALLIDLIFRYGSYLHEDVSPLGIFEWIARWNRRGRRPSTDKARNTNEPYRSNNH